MSVILDTFLVIDEEFTFTRDEIIDARVDDNYKVCVRKHWHHNLDAIIRKDYEG